jgi:hypothetical protein
MKRKQIIYLILFVSLVGLVIAFFSVRRKRLYIKENESTQLFEPEVSTFSFPVYLSVADLEELINRKIKVQIINKQLPIEGGKDSVILKIERLKDIQVSLKNNKFNFKVPLKLEIAFLKNVGFKKNLAILKKDPVTLFITAHFRSDVELKENLKLNTKTKLSHIEWLEEPSLKILGFNFDIKTKASSVLNEKSPEITQMIDKMIQDKVDLRKPLDRIWGKMQKSLPATKHQENLYVKIQPQTVAVYVNKNFSDSIKLDLQVTSKIYIRHGSDTSQVSRTKFPDKVKLLEKPTILEMDRVQIHALLLLSEINKTLNAKLVGKKLDIPGFDIKIAHIKVHNGKKNIVTQIDLKGTLEGTVRVKGIPVLSTDKSRFYVSDLDFESKIRDRTFNSVSDILHDQIRLLLKENLSFDLSGVLSSISNLAQKSIDTTKMAQKAEFRIQELEVEKLQIHLTQNSIQLLIYGASSFEISIKNEGLKFKKPKTAAKQSRPA